LVETAPLTTTHPYGLSKAAAGFACKQLADARGMGFAHLRLFGVFGENEADHRLLPSLAKSLLLGRAIPLSDGLQIRDWLYEEDVGRAVAFTVMGILSGRTNSGIYNVGSGTPASVRSFANLVADILRVDRTLLRFGAIPRRGHEGEAFVADTTAFCTATGWKPLFSLEQGLAMALSRMRISQNSEGQDQR
jgi:nucleoside-diphosphate-sugar epimerase